MKEKEREKDEKEKDREKERERDKIRDKDREREKEREKIREKEKLKSKEKDRDSEKKKDRAKDPEKEKDGRIREHDRDRGKEHEREKERVKDLDRERDKERDRGGDKDKKKEKDRSKKDRDKEREKDKEREREREKVVEREKLGEREKEREKDREKVAERDKEKESVGDREKDREKVGEGEKERDKDRDKDREREREKEREREEKDRQKSRLKEKDRGRDHERDRDGREKERDHERDRDRDRDERDRDRDRDERDRDRQKERDHDLETRERKRDDKSSKDSSKPQASTSALEERIAKMREERQRANAEQRSSAKKRDPQDDIMSWVNKSRMLEQQKKRDEMEKAARMAKILSEQDVEEDADDSGDELRSSGYGGKDLAGLKVRHGLDKVMEGGAVVLTLKDVNVLDGDDVNEATDELENIEMAQQIAREDAYKAAKKKTGVYEDKFNNDINAAPRTILPQYDDIVKDEGVVLDETGGINEESKKRLEEARLRLEGVSAKVSLHGIMNIASDYFTQEDMLQFRKPKKKKKLRKKDKLDLDELEAEAVAAGLGRDDLGSRNSEARREKKQLDDQAQADARKAAYDNALRKGQDASRILKEESMPQAMDVDETELPVFGGEEEDDLYKSLDKARQAALKKQREAGGGPQAIAARLVALSEQSAQPSQPVPGSDIEDNRLVFTDTGEFCRSLQLDDVIIRRAGAKDAFGEEDEEAPPEEMEEDTSKAAGGWTEVSELDKIHPSVEEEDDSTGGVEEPITEVSVGKGLAGALSLLKERGTLKETVDWGGRNMDKKRSKLVGIVDESNNQVGQRDILLDRVDEFGRTMTPKEAFRKLSHKFHGKGPGKMKQEKRMKQWQEELRLKQMNSGDTPLMSMEKMREAQAKMHTPYIVISGHIKPGQTSDPRSGFATVEKEPIGSLTPMLGDKVGSLTPMLGDKKVEHFLGIKRKADTGSMGPPPPKQPKVDRQ
ncbi:U4/U6.U5 tri-snRNP-associated protein 1 [Marchantia polymorpha subsp. ruderalis]|uniref:SART-1 family protein DOT2 n=2 Tax=Marchantia polymorpha TaxID=3197 RepID=A0A176VUA6_MARPO|nr:hypothetical protein AXG93_4776s1070 [Marchantia polymorpha subsp. ruderalis]PTQ36457.1 hypothetical protein MARPO_0063s0006 [Marchantia polymorpha]BBN19255.1 hypothetical protein Mp_8g09130 [Marchantia polymorpha subsp. ruderalis]|eukprot:PTQ36457.1 hypothetical protein MARPO_0063s0006 [Marchantia polymorpha]